MQYLPHQLDYADAIHDPHPRLLYVRDMPDLLHELPSPRKKKVTNLYGRNYISL